VNTFWFSNFMDCIVDDCLRSSNLHSKILDSCASWHQWLDLLLVGKWQRHWGKKSSDKPKNKFITKNPSKSNLLI